MLSALSLFGCESSERISLSAVLDADGNTHTVGLPRSSALHVTGTSPGGLVELEIDCKPSDGNPDDVGFQFTLDAPDFGMKFGPPARAGYLRVVATVAAGPIAMDLRADDGPASCTLHLTKSTACGPRLIYRSTEVGHNHVDPSSTPTSWEAFPVSGDHYPFWVPWNQSYSLPIRTGYLLHNLEHGGVALSYRCLNMLEDPTCTQAQADLAAVRAGYAMTSTRIIDTPDPDQPSLYAARSWRWAYLADCFDRAELDAFVAAHLRHGREDIDSDYPAAFDPTR